MAEIGTSHERAFAFWKEHNNSSRPNTDLVAGEFLRQTHPECHIACTTQSKCDLLGYAAAGHATATPENNLGCDTTREYKAAGARLHKKPGKLEDDVKFGRWLYTWQDKDYVVYEVNYTDLFRPPTNLLYVLSPHSQEAATHGHHAATDALLFAAGEWTKELHDEIYVFDNTHWQKDKKLWNSVQGASWDDVILDPDMKKKLIEDVESFFDNREIYESLNVPWKRGVIFHGVPGNGKTVSIKALVKSLAMRAEPIPSLYVKNLDDSCSGPKHSMQEVFSKARLMAPCLLIFEDLDSLVEDKTRSYFLNEVDGLESNEGILMIGSTNHLSHLDSSITKRPSRFDRKYHFKLPDEQGRIAYCRYWSRKFAGSHTVDFPDDLCPLIAKMTEGFSFAYLKELFITSLLMLAPNAGAYAEPEETDAVQGDSPPSDSSSTSDGVVVERAAVTAEGCEDAGKMESVQGDAEIEKVKPKKPKKVMPHVEIPETLRDNMLLSIIKAQAKLLLEEMDNTEEDSGVKKVNAPSCSLPLRPDFISLRR